MLYPYIYAPNCKMINSYTSTISERIDAQNEYEKARKLERKKLHDEINRRLLLSDYNV